VSTSIPEAARQALPYASLDQQSAIRNLLAIHAEINASLRPGLDHQVAHTRLAWWQQECERAASGTAAHPLLRELCAATQASAAAWPQLGGWIRATALQLAGVPLNTEPVLDDYAGADSGTLFVALAQLLAAPPATSDLWLQIGTHLGAIEVLAEYAQPADAVRRHELLRIAVAQIPPPLQPQLRALLVWLAMASHRAARRMQARAGSPWQGFAETLLAWKSARAADRQSFQLRALQETH
jgi:hypothetical protein